MPKSGPIIRRGLYFGCQSFAHYPQVKIITTGKTLRSRTSVKHEDEVRMAALVIMADKHEDKVRMRSHYRAQPLEVTLL